MNGANNAVYDRNVRLEKNHVDCEELAVLDVTHHHNNKWLLRVRVNTKEMTYTQRL